MDDRHYQYLDKINSPADLKRVPKEDLGVVAAELRSFIIDEVAKHPGHLGSSLGVVELTVALHYVFDTPYDRIIWDVGHQAYGHKILTGRRDVFHTNRQLGGISGFPTPRESEYDAFGTGHASTSISAGLGMSVAALLKKDERRKVVAVIGDGAMTGGLAFEGLNNTSMDKNNLLIILNDNQMAIDPIKGGFNQYLVDITTSRTYNKIRHRLYTVLHRFGLMDDERRKRIIRLNNSIKARVSSGQPNIFEGLNIRYFGPVDGHDVQTLVRVLSEIKNYKGPKVLHIITKKGKGYPPAEENPAKFHGTGPFDIKTGEPTEVSTTDSYTQVFSKVLTDIAKKDDKVVAITAAMADGTGLSSFAKHFPNRFYDVGIAEEHAMTFAAGLAAGGMKPVFAVYSSFLQRAYDQTLHDVCLQNLPVVIAVDRAGLVGSDGETHQGVFDLSFLSTIPNMTVISPKNRWEMADMLRFAVDFQYPIAIRYPRGSAYEGMRDFRAPIEYGKSEILYEEEDIAVIFVGHMAELADRVRKKIKETGYSCSLVNARFVKPLDKDMLEQLAKDHSLFVTIEENVITGGFGEQVMDYVSSAKLDVHVRNIGISDDYVEHGNVEILRKEVGLDCDTIVKQAISDYLMIKDR